MKNLDLIGVQELDAKEIMDTDGGFLLLDIALSYYLYTHWDEVTEGFNDARN